MPRVWCQKMSVVSNRILGLYRSAMLRYLSYWFMLPGNYKHGFSGSTLFWINTEVGADLRCQANNKRHWHMPTKQQSAGVYARKPTRQPKEPQKRKGKRIVVLFLKWRLPWRNFMCFLHWCWHKRFSSRKFGNFNLTAKPTSGPMALFQKKAFPGQQIPRHLSKYHLFGEEMGEKNRYF